MNKKTIHSPVFLLTMASSLLCLTCTEPKQPVQLKLQSAPWTFDGGAPTSTLSKTNAQATFDAPSDTGSFTIKLRVNVAKREATRTLLHIPGVLEVTSFLQDADIREAQNYPAYPLSDGSVPVLQAALRLHPLPNSSETAVRDMPVGIPLGMLPDPHGTHEVVLHFSGVEWTMYVDDELLDNDFALGYPQWGKQSAWSIDTAAVTKAEVFFPGLTPRKTQLATPRTSPEIQYWTPGGHNTWVGDVATFYHEGRYHVFYLFDRRGHASKFGRGGHYFEHLSTTDFKTWTEHPAATPIETQWETLGTGTPFIADGKFCISYGLHTTRIYPAERTTLPLLWDYHKTNGLTGSFRYDTIPGFPAGSTYSISTDGIANFKKTHILFHPCENPSVYTDPDGNLRMLANYGAKGTWGSDSINGGWKSLNPGFPPGGDCTFFFRWGGFDYVIGGFTGLWSKPSANPGDEYQDVVKQGLDFYNGMCVPAVSEIHGGRFLLAGWIPIANWGGTLNIHEMIQYPDGRIGTKWMEEIIPATETARHLPLGSSDVTETPATVPSFLLTFDVSPGTDLAGKLGLVLTGEGKDEHAYEFQISPLTARAQYGKGNPSAFADNEKTLREGGFPNKARHYAIENLIDTDKPFAVRMIVKYDEKFGGSQIDAEIAGQRTMITFCPGLQVEKLLLRTDDTQVKNVMLAALTH